MDREIYQKQYDFELEQRNVIASSTNTPVVSITVIGGALSSMVMTYPYSNNFHSYAFLLFVAFSSLSAIVALFYIFKSVIGYSYQKIPSPVALSEHYKELVKWHKENGTDETLITQESKKDFEEYFENRLSGAAENNGNNNLKRGNYIHDATVSIAIAAAFMVVSTPFFLYSKANGENNIHKIEVVNPITLNGEALNMTENKNSAGSGGDSGTPNTTPAQQPAAPAPTQPKPTGPPNVTFKGGVDPVKETFNAINKSSSGKGRGEK